MRPATLASRFIPFGQCHHSPHCRLNVYPCGTTRTRLFIANDAIRRSSTSTDQSAVIPLSRARIRIATRAEEQRSQNTKGRPWIVRWHPIYNIIKITTIILLTVLTIDTARLFHIYYDLRSHPLAPAPPEDASILDNLTLFEAMWHDVEMDHPENACLLLEILWQGYASRKSDEWSLEWMNKLVVKVAELLWVRGKVVEAVEALGKVVPLGEVQRACVAWRMARIWLEHGNYKAAESVIQSYLGALSFPEMASNAEQSLPFDMEVIQSIPDHSIRYAWINVIADYFRLTSQPSHARAVYKYVLSNLPQPQSRLSSPSSAASTWLTPTFIQPRPPLPECARAAAIFHLCLGKEDYLVAMREAKKFATSDSVCGELFGLCVKAMDGEGLVDEDWEILDSASGVGESLKRELRAVQKRIQG